MSLVVDESAVPGFAVRRPVPGDDSAVEEALGDWMDPDRVAQLLPRAYLIDFADTSVVARSASGEVAGFLIAFPSVHSPSVGYVHFVWVAPQFRGAGLGRALYAHAFDLLRSAGCRLVEAVTSPRNPGAAAFHAHLGFDRDARATGADIQPEPGVVVFTLRL
jgi:predicted GNAT superfamily acetyltransferase